jgi:hypothetical protein
LIAGLLKKHQIVMIVTGATSDWEYFAGTTDQSLKRQSAFNGGKHD